MFNDGVITSMLDGMLIVAALIGVLFVAVHGRRLQASPDGRLLLWNGFTWLLVVASGLLFRTGRPEQAALVLVPVGVAVIGWFTVGLVSGAKRVADGDSA